MRLNVTASWEGGTSQERQSPLQISNAFACYCSCAQAWTTEGRRCQVTRLLIRSIFPSKHGVKAADSAEFSRAVGAPFPPNSLDRTPVSASSQLGIQYGSSQCHVLSIQPRRSQEPCRLRFYHQPDRAETPETRLPIQRHLRR